MYLFRQNTISLKLYQLPYAVTHQQYVIVLLLLFFLLVQGKLEGNIKKTYLSYLSGMTFFAGVRNDEFVEPHR